MESRPPPNSPAAEPPKPERGLTAAERGRDISEAQAETEQLTGVAKVRASLGPRFYFSMAAGYPLLIKVFLWFCLALVYPVWVVAVLFALAGYYVLYAVLQTLFLPLRLWLKVRHPDRLEAWKREQREKRQREKRQRS